jgi:hypothetical protein
VSGPQVTIDRPDVDEPTPAELQAAARAAYLEAAAHGAPPTGTQLGKQFDRSGRWGRDRIAEAKATTYLTSPSPADPPTGPGGRRGAGGPATTSTATAPGAGGSAPASPGGPPPGLSRHLVPADPVEAGIGTAPSTEDGTHTSPGRGHGPTGDAKAVGATAAGGAQDGSGNAAVGNQPPASQGRRTGGSGNSSVHAAAPTAVIGSERNGNDNRPAAVQSGPSSVTGSHGYGPVSVAGHPIDGAGQSPAGLVVPTSIGTWLDDHGPTGNGSHDIATPLPSAGAAAATDTGRESGSRQAAAEAYEDPSWNGAAAAHVQSTARGSGVAAAAVITPSNGSGPSAAPAGGGSQPPPAGTWSRRIIRWVTTIAVIVVAGCAARSSYEHQRTVVEMAGEHRSAWYMPLSVDGMMLIASLNMLVRRWDGQRAGWLTWTALLLGGAASLAANIAAAEPTLIGRVVAGWSPVCLIVSYELLMQQLPRRGPATTEPRR